MSMISSGWVSFNDDDNNDDDNDETKSTTVGFDEIDRLQLEREQRQEKIIVPRAKRRQSESDDECLGYNDEDLKNNALLVLDEMERVEEKEELSKALSDRNSETRKKTVCDLMKRYRETENVHPRRSLRRKV